MHQCTNKSTYMQTSKYDITRHDTAPQVHLPDGGRRGWSLTFPIAPSATRFRRPSPFQHKININIAVVGGHKSASAVKTRWYAKRMPLCPEILTTYLNTNIEIKNLLSTSGQSGIITRSGQQAGSNREPEKRLSYYYITICIQPENTPYPVHTHTQQ